MGATPNPGSFAHRKIGLVLWFDWHFFREQFGTSSLMEVAAGVVGE
jgi:hypothetical protein